MTVTRTLAPRLGVLVLALTAPTLAVSALAVPNVAGPGSPAIGGELTDVTWRGKSVAIEAVSDVVGDAHLAAVREHLARYEDWVRANDYHVALSEDARVILITASKKASKRRMKLVETTLESFDALMSPPDRAGSDETFEPAAWGEGDHVPDAEPVVLIEVNKENEYRALLAGIGELQPRLEGWARSQSDRPGFAEEQVSAAAWQSAPDGYEIGKVWRSENELVNRLARLMIHRSYGPQPTWLRVAGAWRVEMDVMDSIYCFPYRHGFVGVGEHGGWEADLKRQFKKRKKDPLSIDEFAGWERNTWDDGQAQLAWGFVEYLARHEEGSLSAVAEEFRKRYKAGYKTTYPDGSWTTDPSFQVSVEDQLEVLRTNAGDDVMETASDFFRAWKRYKPKKR